MVAGVAMGFGFTTWGWAHAIVATIIVPLLWILRPWSLFRNRRSKEDERFERLICEKAERAVPGTRAKVLSNGEVFLTHVATGKALD